MSWIVKNKAALINLSWILSVQMSAGKWEEEWIIDLYQCFSTLATCVDFQVLKFPSQNSRITDIKRCILFPLCKVNIYKTVLSNVCGQHSSCLVAFSHYKPYNIYRCMVTFCLLTLVMISDIEGISQNLEKWASFYKDEQYLTISVFFHLWKLLR